MKPGVTFAKELSPNDTGATQSHQAGILIPKNENGPLSILPKLNPAIKNPETWLVCRSPNNKSWRLRFIYYNNKLHPELDPETGVLRGSRNEYRLTHTREFLREAGAQPGDHFLLSGEADGSYNISLRKAAKASVAVIRLCGWRQIH
jgi:Restriction endonuclease EcoRII, N-terminal